MFTIRVPILRFRVYYRSLYKSSSILGTVLHANDHVHIDPKAIAW